ncbi:hypothetical protein DW665_04015 [Parabacteroides sp. AM25-14]|nr:hypothetical protein DW665_04015 [Parabacteroides sp. AM25-14]
MKQLYKPNHRFKSWEHCFMAFSDFNNDIDYLTLQLAFYLASWGMYRGSSELLQKDYLIHEPVVEIVRSNGELRKENVTYEDIESINEIIEKIKKEYKVANVSRTLVSKILLGTLGCIPALDRFFCDGWKICEETKGFSINLQNIISFADKHKIEIEECRNCIKSNVIYPPMKIVDMYFWQIGYDEYFKKKNIK